MEEKRDARLEGLYNDGIVDAPEREVDVPVLRRPANAPTREQVSMAKRELWMTGAILAALLFGVCVCAVFYLVLGVTA